MTDSTTCSICFDEFNKSTRMKSSCPYCNTGVCRTCLQTYLLSDISDTPRCVNVDCGHGWERDFLDTCLTATFRLKVYKEHREKVLMDREKARLPETQAQAANYAEGKRITDAAQREINKLDLEIAALERLKRPYQGDVSRAYGAVSSLGQRPVRQLSEVGQPTNTTPESAAVRAVAAAFIRPCPGPDCRGFLSTAWKCGICNCWTCPDCHEFKGENRTTEHTCNPENVATAALINRESKACPKCGVRISKIDGCDQMWCTACNTAFNWKTGIVATGPVHNPHYFEYLRRQGLDPTAQPNNPCGDRQLDQQVVTILFNRGYMPYRIRGPPVKKLSTSEWLGEVWRLMRQDEDELRFAQEANDAETLRQLRVKYMVGETNEEDWKIILQRTEKDHRYHMAKRQVQEVFAGGSRDLIRRVLEPTHDKEDIRTQVQNLIDYCNESYKNISKQFGRKIKPIHIQDAANPQSQSNQTSSAMASGAASDVTTATATSNPHQMTPHPSTSLSSQAQPQNQIEPQSQ